jgi:hypothetical protein
MTIASERLACGARSGAEPGKGSVISGARINPDGAKEHRVERGTARDADGRGTIENVSAPNGNSSDVIAPERAPVTVLQIFHVSGIWSVTKDNKFYGHYLEQRPAFDAAEEAAFAIVANGSLADVVWNDPSPEGSIGAIRTMEYRPRSGPILR